MPNCSYRYKNIVKVEFFEDKDSVIKFSKPFVVYDPLIKVGASAEDTGKDCLVLGAAAFVATIDDMSGTLTVNASTDVAGTKYKSVLEYDMDADDTGSFKSQLVNIQRSNYHLRVTYITGAQHIIRSDESSWAFDYKESKGTPHVTITIENISGAQRVV